MRPAATVLTYELETIIFKCQNWLQPTRFPLSTQYQRTSGSPVAPRQRLLRQGVTISRRNQDVTAPAYLPASSARRNRAQSAQATPPTQHVDQPTCRRRFVVEKLENMFDRSITLHSAILFRCKRHLYRKNSAKLPLRR